MNATASYRRAARRLDIFKASVAILLAALALILWLK